MKRALGGAAASLNLDRPPTTDSAVLVPIESASPRVGYAICTVGRSGSTWLAEILASTGELGHPSEYFNTGFQKHLRGPDYPTDRFAQVRRVLSDGMTTNGVYALKVFPIVLADVARRLRWTEMLPNLRYIHWRRRDVLGQALSMCRAFQTQEWRSTLVTQRRPHYDGDAIYDTIEWIVLQDARWELFFARNGIAPLRLIYEEAIENPQAAVDAVAALVGLESRPFANPGKLEITVQRDSLTEEWRARFLSENRNCHLIDEL